MHMTACYLIALLGYAIVLHLCSLMVYILASVSACFVYHELIYSAYVAIYNEILALGENFFPIISYKNCVYPH